MRYDFNVNTFEVTCRIESEIEIEQYTNPRKVQSCVGLFYVRVCDVVGALIPCIAYGDYAMKIKEYAPKGSKVTMWSCAGTYKGETKFRAVKMVLEAYPKGELSDGE